MRRYTQFRSTPSQVTTMPSVGSPPAVGTTVYRRRYPQFGRSPAQVRTLPQGQPSGGTNVSLTGNSGVGSVGTFAIPNVNLTLTGVEGDGAVGILAFGTNVVPGGVSGTGAIGAFTFIITSNVTLIGVLGTGNPGNAPNFNGWGGGGNFGGIAIGIAISPSISM